MSPRFLYTLGAVNWILIAVVLLAWFRWINWAERQYKILRRDDPGHRLVPLAARRVLYNWLGWLVSLVLFGIGTIAFLLWVALHA